MIISFRTFYLTESNYTTLKDLYPEEPEDSERIWDYWKSDRGEKLEINTMPFHILRELLVNGENILDVYEENATEDQKEIVKKYMKKDPGGVVVIDGDRIIDGHHRIIAAILKKRNVRFVDLSNPPLTEDIRKSSHLLLKKKKKKPLSGTGKHPRDILPVTKNDDTNVACMFPSSTEDEVSG